jgi:peptide-methionine (S)-S-oxide reductase
MEQSCDIPRVATHHFPDPEIDTTPATGEQTAVLAGGCFWCVEAVYKEIDGVLSVRSGYSGGTAQTADYESVCSGMTDHAEAIEVRFDPSRTSFGQLLKVFFSVAHDPTQLNRQGADQGRQYRSAIFTTDAEQQRVAEAYIRQLNDANVLGAPIVTQVVPLEKFYEAEAYHQDYAARNPRQPYVAFTAGPKVEKLRKYYPERLKSSAR